MAGPATAPPWSGDGLLDELDALTPWAPLHQPQNLAAIREVADHRPGLPQVACFDTAFHTRCRRWRRATHSAGAARCRAAAVWLPRAVYTFIAGRLRALAPERSRVIVAHLGNGASLCALRDGRSVDTTMGLTPLDGLMMGTRSGAVDPGLVLALLRDHSAEEVTDILYHRSGLKGVSGLASDMRQLAASRHPGGPGGHRAVRLPRGARGGRHGGEPGRRGWPGLHRRHRGARRRHPRSHMRQARLAGHRA